MTRLAPTARKGHSRRSGRWGAALTLALLGASAATAIPREVSAKLNGGEAIGVASGELDAVERDLPTTTITAVHPGLELRSAEQMIADGELLFRLRDYPRAILVFSQIMLKYPNNKPAYAEAVYRCGEALYASRDFLSARRKFEEVADHEKAPEFHPYASRSVARLVDIAVRVDDPGATGFADDVLVRIAALPPGEVDSTILYAKGKALYFKKRHVEAKATLASVGADGGFQHQARYILGVIALKEATGSKFAPAIETFKKVTDLPGDTDDHKEVVDLAWLAIGRLFYEMDQLDQAVLAYQHVDRASKRFDTMLYELAWVYVRQEDQEKATRSLDLLALANPDSPHAIEGELLKADVLLRKAEFKKALETYERVRDQLDPLRKRIDGYLGSGKSASDYYDMLTGTDLDALDGPDALPPIAIKWAKEQQDGALAFSVVESVQQTKQLLTEAQSMLDRLQLVARGSNKVKAFPEMRTTYEKILSLLNRVSVARAHVGEGLDDVEPADVSAELGAVRDQRRRLQKIILGLPADDDSFARREDEANAQWRSISQQLQQRQIEIDMLQAQVNALRRYLKTKTTDQGAPIDPARLADYTRMLDETERELVQYRKDAAFLKKQIEAGKVQIGVGDSRFQADEEARDQYREMIEREIALVQEQLGGEAKSYAARARPVITRARATENEVLKKKQALDAGLDEKGAVLKKALDEEQAKLDSYRGELAKFDDDARDVVGGVAKRNFGLVRDKLTALVMRAEVGIVDQAWNEREVRRAILRDRQVELKEQERILDDELRQITSDGAGGLE